LDGLAYPYLKELAERYAQAAVAADKKGEVEEAIANYKRAVELIERMLKLYPSSPLAPALSSLAKKYKARIDELEKSASALSVGGLGGESLTDDVIAAKLVVATKPSVTFDDVVDLEQAKRALREVVVYPVKRPDLYPDPSLRQRGVLLFGPPGCGKTMLGAALANEIDGIFIYLDSAHVMSKWLGEAEKNVAKVFEFARKKASGGTPVVIFIDELDALFGLYDSEVGGEARVRNQFLKEMDGLKDKLSVGLPIFVVGATNKPWRLDEAFLRRFNKRVYVPPPNKEARLKLLEAYTKSVELAEDVSLEKLAELTEGYSSSDIRDIVIDAYNRVVNELFETHGGVGRPRPVSMEDFLEVLKRRKPSLDPLLVKRLEKWAEDYKAL